MAEGGVRARGWRADVYPPRGEATVAKKPSFPERQAEVPGSARAAIDARLYSSGARRPVAAQQRRGLL